MDQARKNRLTEEIKKVAENEGLNPQKILQRVAKGHIVIPSNINRKTAPMGVGKGLTTKINANVGSSPEFEDVDLEVLKTKEAVKFGADAVMDLSTGPEYKKVRKAIMEATNLPIGTVPIYQAGIEASKSKGAVVHMDEDDMFSAIEEQAKEGVDFMTLHCGLTLDNVEKVQKSNRTMGIVSRGGAFLAAWMLHNKEENPLYHGYDYLLEICGEYDVTISLGDSLRPGCLADATDIPQISELNVLGELVEVTRENGVQVMVEGPGHVPLNQVQANMQIQKSICQDAPFYVLGPIVTDMAPGYDHITSAIGGAVAACAGADFLCYVTPAEHLSIPNLKEVKEGVIASKIAAQAADVALGMDSSWDMEMEMARSRKNFDWERQFELAFDSDKPKKCRERSSDLKKDMCTMCGEFCALKMVRNNI
jgi:phosphomethylpyrimidine synthase